MLSVRHNPHADHRDPEMVASLHKWDTFFTPVFSTPQEYF